ncbi:MAG: TetR/AcrR family transcriptional regulator [Candidatus Jettenia sp.]|uniref:Transcriptional regulator n=1 Tax=Candidatus Jettenia caeni TaxID=247490 RepID=I3IR06_9BACT|nr:TetR/AcrR family transcriptional regulator [Candidatus Jettenia sp. AMX1]MBC6929610.1 TetR/AcrR family transcriptional regulator [Candidatus Jettenia sp.]NUN21896.1 TetR/AcrR family transcriptional regulator [Candidatus Jettenia caeni]KAA0247950.1 MAG: TetR/AcrR family transcriptional regulator [Candidatus Jettenia sp. AMX1]MCE7879730.1 TetR/AcrR family transcriptional regulator [Candidatus Jettenia sp. AMX1]MCQ3927771.1 TetR/AcrR family transcriptional regulator [Candidatus Jettenia sp.]
MSTEKLDTEVRQSQIAQAALSLIASYGLKGLSIARIARKVGLVPSAIYRHFKNKEEMLDAILHHIQKRLLDNVDIVCNETPEPIDQLRRLLMYHVKLIRENQGILRIIFSEDLYHGHPERKGKVYNIIINYLNCVDKIIIQGQQEGKIRRDIGPATISLMFLGIIQPSAILWHISDGKFDVTRHAEKTWKTFSECLVMK